jgi:hypothetical protein
MPAINTRDRPARIASDKPTSQDECAVDEWFGDFAVNDAR